MIDLDTLSEIAATFVGDRVRKEFQAHPGRKEEYDLPARRAAGLPALAPRAADTQGTGGGEEDTRTGGSMMRWAKTPRSICQ